MKTPEVHICANRVDLFLKRETPAFTWPEGKLLEWERFSFPLRSLARVRALADECAELSYTQARALLKERRRAIQWGA
jgi:hypothetical protein